MKSECPPIVVDEKYRHVQGRVVVTLSISSSIERPNALRNDRAIISHDVIKKPRGPIGGVDGGMGITVGLVIKKASGQSWWKIGWRSHSPTRKRRVK